MVEFNQLGGVFCQYYCNISIIDTIFPRYALKKKIRDKFKSFKFILKFTDQH